MENVLKIVKTKGTTFSLRDKITMLSFDEISLSNLASIDRKHEQKIGTNKNSKVLMARGLFDSWKQPVYYDFDQSMTEVILSDI